MSFGKTNAARQADRLKPKLRRAAGFVHVDVRRLIRFVAVEVEAIAGRSENRWQFELLIFLTAQFMPDFPKKR